MDSGAFPLKSEYPVAIVGAGPVGLTTALALSYYQIPFVVFEANAGLSTETKAGTTLIRTLEVWQRFGAADRILSRAMRVDEIGDIERATNRKRDAVKLHLLRDETRFPFVINLPQSDMEPVLRDCLTESKFGKIHHRHRLTDFTQHADHVTLELVTPDGKKTFDASFLLGCDGGRSTVRDRLGVSVEGRSLPERFALVDLKVDLDVENPRDFPYLGYFSDAEEWMILVRQPECWRFLYPVFEGQREFCSVTRRTSSRRCGRSGSTPASSMLTIWPGASLGSCADGAARPCSTASKASRSRSRNKAPARWRKRDAPIWQARSPT
jgi:3-(3-hydroxy-phenyl)propionate hydroxylase